MGGGFAIPAPQSNSGGNLRCYEVELLAQPLYSAQVAAQLGLFQFCSKLAESLPVIGLCLGVENCAGVTKVRTYFGRSVRPALAAVGSRYSN